MSARSSRSFARRTAPGSATAKQIRFLNSLLDERDVEACPYASERAMLAGLRDDRAEIERCSLAGVEDFITAALTCPVLGACGDCGTKLDEFGYCQDVGCVQCGKVGA